jgi:hypothetical protein
MSGILLAAAFVIVPLTGASITTNIFSTQFEAAKGYSTATNLVDQNGWLGFGSGGNGVVTNYLEGYGQQAFIGFFPPDPGDDQLYVWRPINLSPSTNMAIVQFSVLMSIVDSSNTNYDNFYWSVYNAQGDALFTIDFDNYDLGIYYLLDGTNDFVWTGEGFTNDDTNTLVITMNFLQNSWSATFDGVLLATNQPITTTGAPRNLGDIDAVWAVFDPENPGDNYLLFDNYRITAEVVPPPTPRLETFGYSGNGPFPLRVVGQSGARFAIDATTNLTVWTALKTNVITDGYFDYVDSSAPAFTRRYYRARWSP